MRKPAGARLRSRRRGRGEAAGAGGGGFLDSSTWIITAHTDAA